MHGGLTGAERGSGCEQDLRRRAEGTGEEAAEDSTHPLESIAKKCDMRDSDPTQRFFAYSSHRHILLEQLIRLRMLCCMLLLSSPQSRLDLKVGCQQEKPSILPICRVRSTIGPAKASCAIHSTIIASSSAQCSPARLRSHACVGLRRGPSRHDEAAPSASALAV